MAEDEPQVSDAQKKQTAADTERKQFAVEHEHVSSETPNPLVESRTVRNPLVPQPEPDADPLQPMLSRPSRSRSSENDADGVAVEETRTGSEGQADTHIEPGDVAPQPGPDVAEPDPAQRDDLGRVKTDEELRDEQKADRAAARKRAEAGKRAAATRKANEEHEKRVAAGKKAAATRAKNEGKK